MNLPFGATDYPYRTPRAGGGVWKLRGLVPHVTRLRCLQDRLTRYDMVYNPIAPAKCTILSTKGIDGTWSTLEAQRL